MEHPDAADLLATARAVLLEKLLPALPEALKLEARMVASAMAIAGRATMLEAPGGALEAPGGAREATDAALAAPDGAREATDAALAASIRAGAMDGDAGLLPRLRKVARARLAISNPRALP